MCLDNRTYTMQLTNETALPIAWIEAEGDSWGCDCFAGFQWRLSAEPGGVYCAALSNTFLRAAESRAAVGSSEAVLERAAHEQFHWPPDNLKGGPRLGGIDGVDTKHQPAEAPLFLLYDCITPCPAPTLPSCFSSQSGILQDVIVRHKLSCRGSFL